MSKVAGQKCSRFGQTQRGPEKEKGFDSMTPLFTIKSLVSLVWLAGGRNVGALGCMDPGTVS